MRSVNDDCGENWQAITDATQRRKVQNRINQRASRQRRAQNGTDSGLVVKQWSLPRARRRTPIQNTHQDADQIDLDDSQGTGPDTLESTFEDRIFLEQLAQLDTQLWCMSPQELVRRRRPRCQSAAASITADHLLTLIYLNVFRGLMWNIQILGLDTEQMYVDDYPSPFLPCSPTATSSITKLPPGLRPTSLQKSIDHHPYIDVFPCPRMRDNLIQTTMDPDEEEQLCVDLMGISEGVNEGDRPPEGENRIGATVWNDPWQVSSWEISAHLAGKWPWIFVGCFELQMATNQRRIARGWKAISFA